MAERLAIASERHVLLKIKTALLMCILAKTGSQLGEPLHQGANKIKALLLLLFFFLLLFFK